MYTHPALFVSCHPVIAQQADPDCMCVIFLSVCTKQRLA